MQQIRNDRAEAHKAQEAEQVAAKKSESEAKKAEKDAKLKEKAEVFVTVQCRSTWSVCSTCK